MPPKPLHIRGWTDELDSAVEAIYRAMPPEAQQLCRRADGQVNVSAVIRWVIRKEAEKLRGKG